MPKTFHVSSEVVRFSCTSEQYIGRTTQEWILINIHGVVTCLTMRSQNAAMRLHIHVVYIHYSVHCLAVVMARFVVNSCDAWISMHECCFSGIGTIFWLHQYQWCGTETHKRDWPLPKTHIHTYKKNICSHMVSICKALLVHAFYHIAPRWWSDDLPYSQTTYWI